MAPAPERVVADFKWTVPLFCINYEMDVVSLARRTSLSFFLPSHFTAKSRIPLVVKYIEFDNSKKDFLEDSVLFWVT